MKKNYLLCCLIMLCLFGVVEAQNTIKVMTFNKLYSTSNSSLLSVVSSSGADIIGIQENYGAAQNAANSLGFYYHNISRSEAILSRYPITSTYSSGIQITLPNGLEIYVFNTHLTSYPYQPYDLRDRRITTESQAIQSANTTRGAQMNSVINNIQSIVPAGSPVFLTGDFNEPSHLDWTQRASNAQIHAIKIAWPTSKRATNIGLKDSWRSIYPNEVSKPGNTWTPIRSTNEVYDRIDMIYHRGNNVTATTAVRFGPNGDEAELNLNRYTSDHRAMMTTYSLPEPNTDGDISYGSNLLQEGSAEQSNLNTWTQISGNRKRVRAGQNGFPSAQDGNYIFYLGSSRTGEMYQDINVEQYASTIDNSKQSFLCTGFVRSYRGNDRSRIKIEYRTSNNVVLETFDSGWRNNSSRWEQIKEEKIAPIGTRIIRVIILSQRNRGSSNDGYFDNLSLKTGVNNRTRTTFSTKKIDPIAKSSDFLEKNSVYKIWPNPLKQNINISFNETTSGELLIIDMIGRIIKKKTIHNISNLMLKASDFSNGMYILQFKDKKGDLHQEYIIKK